MWHALGDLLRSRSPAGACAVLLPSLAGGGLLLGPLWLPDGGGLAEHAGLMIALGLCLGATGIRVWWREDRRRRRELQCNPIHRWPPLPAHDRTFIRSRLQRR